MGVSADWVSAITAVFAAATAAGAWRTAVTAARTSEQSTLATETAADAAAMLTDIEKRRFHAEKTPEFELVCLHGHGSNFVLRVRFVGPPGVDHLHSVAITVRNDQRRIAAPFYTEEQRAELESTVWGPLRFRPGLDGIADDRTSREFALDLDEPRSLTMEPSAPPSWQQDAEWRAQFRRSPLRLMIRCEAAGFDAWNIPLEVDVTHNHQPTEGPCEWTEDES